MKFKAFKRNNSGFTLIELLVVIGILGILAAGLLLTIDPLEKFKQGNDTNTQQSAVDLENALTAFYSTHSDFPWGPNGGNCLGAGSAPSKSEVDTTFLPCISTLTTAGELKSTFATATNVTKNLLVTYNASTNQVSVCFDPQSKSMSQNTATKFDPDGTTTGSCDPSTSTTCYWCAQ
jgi:prepilin-type N-terminal cleavage/methylation domain-containing protein